LADLVAVRGNPLEDVRVMEDVPWVMQGGIVVKGD
jgi:imidazolonepropionase-like amidohydrolase